MSIKSDAHKFIDDENHPPKLANAAKAVVSSIIDEVLAARAVTRSIGSTG